MDDNISLNDKELKRVADFLHDSNLLDDFKGMPREKIVENLKNPEFSDGLAGVYKEAKFMAINKIPLTLEKVFSWQEKITTEQTNYGRPISKAYRGSLRDVSMQVGGRVLRPPKKEDIESIIDNMNKNIVAMQENPKLNNILSYSAKTHVEFLEMFPFFDANGRVGRIISNYFIEFFGYPPIIFTNEDSKFYFFALKERANKLDFRKISEYFIFKHELTDEYKRQQQEIIDLKKMFRKDAPKKSFWKRIFGS